MSRQLPPEGDYTAKATGQLKIFEAETGTIGVAIPYKLTDSEIPFSDTHTVYIAKSDGTILQVGMDALKKVFGWDGLDPWWLMWEDPGAESTPRLFPDLEFKLADCKHERSNKEGSDAVYFKPSWLNPIDGGRSFKPADRSAFMKSFGSKFRAAAGGKPATPPAKKGGLPKPPGKKVEPCTAEEAYEVLVKTSGLSPSKDEEKLSGIYYGKIAEMFPKADAQNLTKEQYGELREAFSKS